MTIAARPTTYSGIAMRSRTEARFAAFLDRVDVGWKYEPRAYASHEGQYLPDFQLFGWAQPVFIEVKGTYAPGSWPALQARMRIVRSSEREAVLGLAVPDRRDLLLDFPSTPSGGCQRAVFATCPRGHLCLGIGQGPARLRCPDGYDGPPITILHHFAEVA